MTDPEEDLRRAVETLARGFHAASVELELLQETEIPTPDRLSADLVTLEVVTAVLRRVLRAAPVERRRRLAEMCREEAARRIGRLPSVDLGGVPVLPEVVREVNAVTEDVRALASMSPAVRELLPGAWP